MVLIGFTSLTVYFFFLYWSPSSSLCTVFDSISSNIDEILSINPSANVFVFGNFNVHHKGWLTYSGKTDTSGESCYNFSISNDLTQIVTFPTRISDCDFHRPALLDLFLLMLVFDLIWSSIWSLHREILIMLLSQFPLTFHHIHNGMPSFIALLMTILVLIGTAFMIIWEMFDGRISLNSMLLLFFANFVNRFRLELMHISLIESIRSSLTHLHGFQ